VNPTRQAIVQALVSSPGLTALLSNAAAVYHRDAPSTAHTPFVILNKQSGRDEPAFHGGRVTYESWLVKAVTYGNSASDAEEIDQAIDAAINGKTFALSNGLTASVIRDTHVDYAEREGDQVYQHVGAVYRVIDP
jgi:hypothetical protein